MRRIVVGVAVAGVALFVARTLRLRAEAVAPLPTDPWPRVPEEERAPV